MVSLHRWLHARLHRRLFAWFSLSILVTFAITAGTMRLMHRFEDEGWPEQIAKVRTFASGQFARVWSDPTQRDALARALHDDLGLSTRLIDAEGRQLTAFGPGCGRREMGFPIRGTTGRIGEVRLCPPMTWRGGGRRFLLVLCIGAAVLWAASGKVSRRLTRPLVELVKVAQDLGAGKLGSRVRLSRHVHGEMAALADAMNEMAIRIEKQMSDQRELLAAVSHELRTPLARIRILTELSRTRGGDERTADELDREVVEMDALVGQLLASSRLDFAALQLTRIDAVDVARRALERAGMDSTVLESTREIELSADATLIARALANLIDNARLHAGGLEKLRVERTNGEVTFVAEDCGPGFSASHDGQLFQPFSPSTKGSLGLGLSLVRRIAEAHGGRAFATNRAPRGAAVGFSVPARSG